MHARRTTTRTLAALLVAAVLSLGLVAAAGAAVWIYGNGFSNKAQVQDLTRTSGGKKCNAGHKSKQKQLRVGLTGKRYCGYSPAFAGDSSQPDHIVWAKGQILPQRTPKSLRKAAYLAVRVRLGKGEHYQLEVRPKGKRFQLSRKPGGAGATKRGRSSDINPLRRMNVLAIQAKGDRITGFVNGKQVASFVDANPNGVPGRKVSFGIGSRRDSKRSTVGVFDRVRAGIAD